MGILEDIMKALDRIPVWKRLQTIPGEVDGLSQRLAALEGKLGGEWPADVCKFCGKRAARLARKTRANEKGIYTERWNCSECHESEIRSLKAK